MTRVVARCNGTLVVDDAGRLGVVEVGGGWLGTAVFVAALVTVITGVNGVVMLAIQQWIAGAILLPIAILAGLVTRAFYRRRRATKDAPPGPPWLVLDPAAGAVRDGAGAVVGPLAQASLKRTFQIGSSSKALSLVLPGRTIVVARGTPFGDSVDAVEAALRPFVPS